MDAFWNSLQDKLIQQASSNDEEYALSGGNLTKGKWKTLPNPNGGNHHVWMVGDTILAGPENLLGRKLKDITPEDLMVPDKTLNGDYGKKYEREMNQLSIDRDMNKNKRAKAIERLQEKNRSEHNYGNSLRFFPNDLGVVESPNMSSKLTADELAKKQMRLERTKKLDELAAKSAGLTQGKTREEKAAFYNQRLLHMEELRNILGKSAHPDIDDVSQTFHNAIKDQNLTGPTESNSTTPPKKKSNPRNVKPPTGQTPVVDNTEGTESTVPPINPSGVPPQPGTPSEAESPEMPKVNPKPPKKPGYWSQVFQKFNPYADDDAEPESAPKPSAQTIPTPSLSTPSVPRLKSKRPGRIDFEDSGVHHYYDNNQGNISIGDNNNQNIGNNSNVGNTYRAFLLNNENRIIMPNSKSKKTQ